MTPAACPPLIPSGHQKELLDSLKYRSANGFQHKRFAESGRAMRCSYVRLEDVALSDRFCVLESFEIKVLARPPYEGQKLFHNISGHGNSPSNATCSGCVLGLKNSMRVERASASTPQKKCIKRSCFRCAINRQLARSEERPVVVRGNAVCGVEVAGPCAGLIMRSHILVEEVRVLSAVSTG